MSNVVARRDGTSLGGAARHVLLVHGDPRTAKRYETWLERQYSVTTARTVDQAIASIDETVDAVLVARRLPDRSGPALLEELRRRGYDRPAVVLTDVDPDDDVADWDAHECLVEPVSEAELLDALTFVVQLRSYEDALDEYYTLLSEQAALEHPDESSDRRDRLASLEARLERSHRTFDADRYSEVFREVLE